MQLTPDLQELLEAVPFVRLQDARARMLDLCGRPEEMLALARLSDVLRQLLLECPDPDRALNNLDRFVTSFGSRLQLYQSLQQDPVSLETLICILSSSQYLADILVRNPELYALLTDRLDLSRTRSLEQWQRECSECSEALASLEGKFDALRRMRRRELLRIGAADLLGMWDLRTVTRQLSLLALALVRRCTELHRLERTSSGLVVFALGKLGGLELNYSSDIDLVFACLDGESREDAARHARAITSALESFSAEGFMYRVDLRLRPYGSSGEVVISLPAYRQYLMSHSDPAERQALLKASVIAGAVDAGRVWLEEMVVALPGPGANARAEVRALKERIERQATAKGPASRNVKLSPGGIRDIEFIVQALQLEHEHSRLVEGGGHTLDSLDRLCQSGKLSIEDAELLRDSYVFLRVLEHRMQLMNNMQVHRLPQDPQSLHSLARLVGLGGEDLTVAYEQHSSRVREIFDRLLPG